MTMTGKNSHLYFIVSDQANAVKVGRSSRPRQRLSQAQTGNPYKLRIAAIAKGQGKHEPMVHEAMRRLRMRGEWFTLSDSMKDLIRHVKTTGSLPDEMTGIPESYRMRMWGHKKRT